MSTLEPSSSVIESALTDRRQFLQHSSLGLMTGATLGLTACTGESPPPAAAASPAAQSSPGSGAMSRERYLQYVDWFNANDPRFLEFYHPDVTLELAQRSIVGPQAIGEFYAEVKAHIHETVEVTHFVSDATGIAAELPTEFRVYKDWENGYFGRPLKVGMVFRVVSLGLYWVEDGKFRRIKAARSKLVNDWQMEPPVASAL